MLSELDYKAQISGSCQNISGRKVKIQKAKYKTHYSGSNHSTSAVHSLILVSKTFSYTMLLRFFLHKYSINSHSNLSCRKR